MRFCNSHHETAYTTSYVYDSANQLIRENNQAANYTYTWTYDDAGNILSRTEYAYTTGSLEGVTSIDTVTYTYGNSNWGDLLTGYDGRTFAYDTVGNLTSDGIHTYTWKHGRQLATLSDGTTTWTYTYNADGLRTKRTNGTDTYNYVYVDGQLVQQTKGSEKLRFSYDAHGVPLAILYNSAYYFYVTNLQGDVIAIVDSNGDLLVEYTYDAWGNILSCTGTMASTLGTLNPLRYRGYVYDTETGLYYLQSRYYNPEIGRFINADAFVSTGQGFIGNNMFAYCGNNPVNYTDSTGYMAMRSNIVLINDGAGVSKKQSTSQPVSATVVVGVGGGVTIGPWTFAGQLGIAADLNDNVELQFSYSVPLSTATPSVNNMSDCNVGLGVSAAVNVTLTNAPDVTKLHGLGHQTGVSLSGAAIDINIIPAGKTTYSGITFSGGLISPDFHHTMGYTVRVAKLNINFWDIVDAAYKGWVGVY